MADILTKSMSFVGPASTDAAFVVSGIGFTPKAVHITTDGSTADDSVTTDVWTMSGFCDTALKQRAIETGAPDSATTTHRSGSLNNAILLRTSTGTITCLADITAFGSGTCTFNFSTVAAPHQSVVFRVTFFGGADLSAELETQIATSAGSVSGLAFQPEFVFAHTHSTSGDNTFGNRQLSIGVFNDALVEMQMVQWGGFGDGTTQQDSKETVVRDTGFLSEISNGSTSYQLSVSSITATGFTWTGGGSSDAIDFLCFNLSGINTDIQTFAKSTASAPVDQVLPIAFNKPGIYGLMTGNKTVETPEGTLAFGLAYSYGVYDADNNGQEHSYITDEQDITENRDKIRSSSKVLSCGTLDAVRDWEATAKTVSTAVTPKITLNPNDATAAIIGIWAWESQVADPVAGDVQFFTGIF